MKSYSVKLFLIHLSLLGTLLSFNNCGAPLESGSDGEADLLSLAIPPWATSATYYVDPAGDDANTGLSPSELLAAK